MTRRADRLFQIVQILRGRRLTTAAHLAERLGVSERTVYRDIRDLSLSGVPVEGEAGSGYRLMSGFDLPPLMLTNKESEALMVAIRLGRGIAVARAGVGPGEGAGHSARGESSKGGANANLCARYCSTAPFTQRF